jgi:hypothetical protein
LGVADADRREHLPDFPRSSLREFSTFLGYRNNFGWKPGIIIMESGLGAELAHPNHRSVSFEIQVWNRRRYPISLLHCLMKLSDLHIDTEMPIETTPHIKDSHYIHEPQEVRFDLDNVLQPNTSVTAQLNSTIELILLRSPRFCSLHLSVL